MSDLSVRVLIEAVTRGLSDLEKMQQELREIGRAGGEAAPKAQQLATEMAKLAQQQTLIAEFTRLKLASQAVADSLVNAQGKAREAALALQQTRAEAQQSGDTSRETAKKIADLERALEAAAKAAKAAKTAQQEHTLALQAARGALQQAGISTTSLSEAQTRLTRDAQAGRVGLDRLNASLRQTGNEASTAGNQVQVAGSRLSEFAGIAQAIAGAAIAKRFLDANLAADSFQRTMLLLTGSSEKADAELKYITATADRMGIPIRELQSAYVGFSAALKGSALEGAQGKLVFESVAHSMAVLGKSSDDTKGTLLALQQMISKGTVQSEELKNQLGERLPNAFAIASRAMGVTERELGKLLETGQVLAADLLPKLALELNKTFGDPQNEVESLQADLGRFQTAMDSALVSLGQAGVVTVFSESISILAGIVSGAAGAFKLLGSTIGYTVGIGVDQLLLLNDAAVKVMMWDFSSAGESLQKALHVGGAATELLSKDFEKVAEDISLVTKHSKAFSAVTIGMGEDAKQAGEQTTAAAQKMSSAFEQTRGVINLSKDSADKLKESLGRALDTGGVSALGLALATIPAEMLNSEAGAKGVDEALKKLDGQQLASLQAQLKTLPITAGDFNSVLKQIAEQSLKKLGLDADLVLTGISKKSQDVIASFKALADSGTLTGEQLARALKAAFTAVDSEKAALNLKAEMIDLGKKGKLTGEQIAAGMKQAEDALTKTHKATTPLEEALDRLGIKAKKALQIEAGKAIADLNEARGALQRGEITAEDFSKALKKVEGMARDAGMTTQAEMLKTELATRQTKEETEKLGEAGKKAGEKMAEGQRDAQAEIIKTGEELKKQQAEAKAAEDARLHTLTPMRSVGVDLNNFSIPELEKIMGGSDGTNGGSEQKAAFNILQQRRNAGVPGSSPFTYRRPTPAPPPPAPAPVPVPPPKYTPPPPSPTPQPVMPSAPQEVIHRIELSTPSGRSISLTANSKMDVDELLRVLADAKSRSAV